MNQTSKWEGEKRSVWIVSGSINLEGQLSVPEPARGIVLFAQGSSSTCQSPRNFYVAEVLNQAGFATLLFDLLTPDEEEADCQTGHLRFKIPFLAQRLMDATEWVAQTLNVRNLKLGYFGANTGAAAALVAAADRPEIVSAVVSGGGRPDLAGLSLPKVLAPTLLIVGGSDISVIGMNQKALAQLRSHKQLEIIPSTTQLFTQPGTLEVVAQLAQEWFEQYLIGTSTSGLTGDPSI